jgi:hypothetical protein
MSTGEPDATEIGHVRFGGGPSEKGLATGTSLAAYPTSRPVREGAIGKRTSLSWRLAPWPTSRKLRGKHLIVKPGCTRRYETPPQAARTIAAPLTLRDQVIAPILAGVRSPRMGRKPARWTHIDRDYETLRIGMPTLFHDLGITAVSSAAA